MNSDFIETNAILARASARGSEAKLPYRGAVTPSEAYELIRTGAAKLIDVRSRFEWDYVGRVPDSTLIEWKRLPSGEINHGFLAELAKAGTPEENYLFLCRSGVRSHAAAQAATEAGYRGAFNILEGFEGDLDERKQRGNKGGWRYAGLPWIQS